MSYAQRFFMLFLAGTIASTLYLAGVIATGLITHHLVAVYLALGTAGVVYLNAMVEAYQLKTKNALTVAVALALNAASVAFGALSALWLFA